MAEKLEWFFIDTRIFPFNFSLVPPTSLLVKFILFLEMILSLFCVFGAIILTLFS